MKLLNFLILIVALILTGCQKPIPKDLTIFNEDDCKRITYPVVWSKFLSKCLNLKEDPNVVSFSYLASYLKQAGSLHLIVSKDGKQAELFQYRQKEPIILNETNPFQYEKEGFDLTFIFNEKENNWNIAVPANYVSTVKQEPVKLFKEIPLNEVTQKTEVNSNVTTYNIKPNIKSSVKVNVSKIEANSSNKKQIIAKQQVNSSNINVKTEQNNKTIKEKANNIETNAVTNNSSVKRNYKVNKKENHIHYSTDDKAEFYDFKPSKEFSQFPSGF